MESSAVSILKQAVDMDKKKKYTLALDLYLKGLDILVKSCTAIKDDHKKTLMRIKTQEYMTRAEEIKKLINDEKASNLDIVETLSGHYRQIKIEAGSTGHGYGSVFGEFLDNSVTYISIEDPYIRAHHQCLNLVRFCELAIQKCKALSRVSLVTTRDSDDGKNQVSRLEELKQSLSNHSISFEVTFSETLHDRQISISNGWVIKIGRGLDYFRAPEKKFVLGACDLELRQCQETTIDIFRCDTPINNIDSKYI